MSNRVDSSTLVKVSSTAPQTSKKNLLTADSDTCWSSTGLPSSIHLIFPTPIPNATHVALTFQGGFVGTTAVVYVATKRRRGDGDVELGLIMGGKIYPEEGNRRQVFSIPYPDILVSPPASPSTKTGLHIVQEIPPNPNGNGWPASHDIHGNNVTMSENGLSRVHRESTPGERVPEELVEIKIEFEKSSDNYGRVTVYQIEVLA